MEAHRVFRLDEIGEKLRLALEVARRGEARARAVGARRGGDVAREREHGVQRVRASTMAVNVGSRRVMEKAGLRLVRTFHAEWPVRIPGDELGITERRELDERGRALEEEYFRKKNRDRTKVPDAFKPLHADCRIQFKLATKDIFGNATNQSHYQLARTYQVSLGLRF